MTSLMVVSYPTETQFYFSSAQPLLGIGNLERMLPCSDALQHLTSVVLQEFDGRWRHCIHGVLSEKKLVPPPTSGVLTVVCCSKHSC